MTFDKNFYDKEYFTSNTKSGYGGLYEQIEGGEKQDRIANFIKANFGGPVLDVGCAFGHLVSALMRAGMDARGIDISEYSVGCPTKGAEGRISVSDVSKGLPVSDRQFNTVVAYQTLEHMILEQIPAVVREMCRVSNQSICIEVPTWYNDDSPDRSSSFDKSHFSFYSASFWISEFHKNGFILDLNLSHKLLGTDSSRLIFYRHDNVPAKLVEGFKVTPVASEADLRVKWEDHYGPFSGVKSDIKVGNTPMKMLVISTSVFRVPLRGYGGLEQLAWEWAVEFQQRGHRVSLVAPEGSKVPDGMELIAMPLMEPEQQTFERYKNRLTDFDIIMDNSWLWFTVIAQLNSQKQLPIIHIYHSDPDYLQVPKPPIQYPCIVGLSNAHASRLGRKWGVQTRMVYNGIPLDFYTPALEWLNVDIVQRSNRYLWLARYTPEKDPLGAIRTAKKCGAELDLYGNTVIVRDQNYINQCMAECDAHQIVFHNEATREETVQHYRTHKALIHLVDYCLPYGNLVCTNAGVTDISELKEGNKVLGHDGKLHDITHIMERDYSGDLVKLIPYSFNIPTTLTPNHPVQIITPKKCAWGDFICQPYCHSCKDLNPQRTARQALYDRVMQLSQEGEKLSQIVKATGVKETTAYYWISGRSHPTKCTGRPYYKNYKPTWKNASEIKKGDYLVFTIPESIDSTEIDLTRYHQGRVLEGKIYPIRGNGPDTRPFINSLPTKLPITDALLKLCGFYAAEGCLLTSGIRFNFGWHEYDLAEETMGLIKSVFGFVGHINREPHSILVDAHSILLPRIFEDWFGNHAENKKIPEWIYLLPPQKSRVFIEGIWRGDGCSTQRTKYSVFEYRTVSPHLGIGLWNMLLKQGIIASIRRFKQGEKAFGEKLMFDISVSGDGAVKFAKLVNEPFNDVRQLKHWNGFSFIYEGKVFLRIREVTSQPFTGKVYNCEVKESESYMCQGVPCHNCEAFGLVPVEAMACGIPVIVNKRGALPELVEDGISGFIVDDWSQVEDIIRTNAVDRIKPADCRKQAEKFSISKSAEGYLSLFRDITEGRLW